MVERWNPFILKGVLTPETQSWQHLSTAAFHNMVIVLLIRILLHIWHPCYVLIEQRIIFWHIFYEITTAINLITIIFLHISVWAWFVLEWTVCLAGIVSHVRALSMGWCMTRKEETEMADGTRSMDSPPLLYSHSAFHPFVPGSDITINGAIHWHTIPHLNVPILWENYTMAKASLLYTWVMWHFSAKDELTYRIKEEKMCHKSKK